MRRYDIAIIGMGCNLPGASSVDRYRESIFSGESFIKKMPERLWHLDNFFSADFSNPEKSVANFGAFLDEFEFPFLDYRLPPNSAKGTDPAQLVMVETTREALDDAGIEPRSAALENAITVIGASGVDGFAHTTTYLRRHRFFKHLRSELRERGIPDDQIERLEKQFAEVLSARGHYWNAANAAVGNIPSTISNRVAQVFGIKGFNMTVDGACASSFIALNVACQALMAGDARVAIAGGCDLGTNPSIYIGFSRVDGLSKTGNSNPFDHTADGLVIGEGVNAVVIKRLEDAVADGDRIHAVIRGIGTSSDGAGQAIYAPAMPGRIEALEIGLRNAETDPSEVQYIEAHATSTIVGDATEYDSVALVYGKDRDPADPLRLGSVKGQIGHLKAAAGVAGLIKTVLAMEEGRFPHMPRFTKLTPEAEHPSAAVVVPNKVEPWEPRPNGKRVAAVTASGFGGVNLHVILEQGEQYTPPTSRAQVSREMAVVGVACRVPGADSVERFWDNVTAGKNVFTRVDAKALDWEDHFDAGPENERITTRTVGRLDDYEFDYLKHKIFPKAVSQIAPTQFLGLDLSDQLLDGAGLDIAERKRIGVSLGAMHDDHFPTIFSPSLDDEYTTAIRETKEAQAIEPGALEASLRRSIETFRKASPPVTEHTLPGWMTNVVAGRIANKLNLSGPNFTVDTACSSGVAALLPAMYLLMFGDVDMVISGGLNRQLGAEFTCGVCTLGAVAEDIPRPFDERGQGFLISEGGVLYLLKRLEDARRDGDEIVAIVHSVSGSSEADSKSMVAPSEAAVRRSIRNAMDKTAIRPEQIGVVDTHGSANVASDLAEAASLDAELPRAEGGAPLQITAIKSHLGHLYGGSGATSVLSTIQTLRTRTVPGIRNLERIRPEIESRLQRIEPRKGTRPLPPGVGAGGVNSLGLGGANYFAVLSVPEAEEAREAAGDTSDAGVEARGRDEAAAAPPPSAAAPPPSAAPPSAASSPPASRPSRPVIRAGDEGSANIFVCLAEDKKSLLATLELALKKGEIPLFIAESSAVTLRLAVTFRDQPELKDKLKAVIAMLVKGHPLAPLQSKGVFAAEVVPDAPVEKLAFTFPGQGMQYIGMGRHQYETNPVFRRVYDQIDELSRESLDFGFLDHVFGDKNDEAIAEELGTLLGAQVSTFAVEAATAAMLEDMGVQPDVVLGQSFGEFCALVAAGAWDVETGFRAVEARIQAAEIVKNSSPIPLGMMSIACSVEQRDALLATAGDRALLTNTNAPGRFIFAGELEAVKNIVTMAKSFRAEASLLPIGSAFHSRFMQPAVEPFREALRQLPCQAPRISILSTVTGEYIDPDGVSSESLADHFASQLLLPVNLVRDVNRLYNDGVRHFLEIGPRWPLTKMVGVTLEGKPFRAAPTLHPKVGDDEMFLRARAFLMALRHLESSATRQNLPELFSSNFIEYLQAREPAILSLIEEVHGRFLERARFDAARGVEPAASAEPAPRPKAPRPSAPAAERPATATAPAPAPVPATAPAAAVGAAPAADVAVWVDRLRERLVEVTGYPAEMLDQDLDLEADLGVDSVQRAEIWTSLLGEYQLDPEARPGKGVRTIRFLAETLAEFGGAKVAASASAAAPSPAADAAVWVDRLRERLVEVTGYPAEMLDQDLDLEADLGVDSVQRAEIWTSLLGEYRLDPEARPGKGVRTIRFLAETLAELGGAAPAAPEPVPVTAPPRTATTDASIWAERLREKLVEVTGYPADMLEVHLDLEADLGVDSVQRAEIWTSLLAEYRLDPETRPGKGVRTIAFLAETLAALDAGATVSGADAASEADVASEASVDTAPAATAAAPSAGAPDEGVAIWIDRLRDRLVEVTGYPADMLEAHLDLEADLGVDSVQRAEIWTSLLDQHRLDPEARPGKGVRTIAFLADTLARLEQAGAEAEQAESAAPGPAAAEQAETAPAAGAASTTDRCQLLVTSHESLPSDELAPFTCRKVLAVLGAVDAGHSAVVEHLREQDIEVATILAADIARLSPAGVMARLDGCDTLVYLAHRGLVEMRADGAELCEALGRETDILFSAFRALAPALAQDPVRVLVPVSQDGAFGTLGDRPFAMLGAFPAGFVRSMQRELPDCRFQLLDAGQLGWAEVVGRQIDVLAPQLEVGFTPAGRVVPTLARLAPALERRSRLDRGDLVLVTGGARGIVFECVLGLARSVGCRLLLTGRTPLPEGEPDWLGVGPDEITVAIRNLEIDLVRSEGLNLGDAKKHGRLARSQWELVRNLGRLEALGIEVRYEVCDVTNSGELGALVRRASSDSEIRGVIHGAGVQRSKLIGELDDEAVERTMATKLGPLFTLLDELDWSKVAVFSAFGSVTGQFGNAGQTDYGLANDLLTWAVKDIGLGHPHLQAQTIEWTAWAGAGMVTEEEIKRFEEAGLTPLDVASGVELFLEGLNGSSRPQLAAFNPSAGFASTRRIVEHPIAARPRTQLLDDTGSGGAPVARLSLDGDVYLKQHLVNGEPVVPGTFIAEMFHEAARQEDLKPSEMSFRRPFSIRQDDFEVEVVRIEDSMMLVPASRPELEPKGLMNLSFATCRVGKAAPRTSKRTVDELGFDRDDLQALQAASGAAGEASFYSLLDRNFSSALRTGPVFRGIQSTVERGDRFLGLVTLTEEAAAMLEVPGGFEFNPVLADMAVQVACSWAMQTHQVMAIPAEVGEMDVESRSHARQAVVVCRALELSPEQTVVNVAVRELDGKLVFGLDRLVLKTIARIEDAPSSKKKTLGRLKDRSLPSDNDVVVIGAGLGGLTSALELASRGLKVCVLEQHRVPGGYAHSFRRKGYTFDVSLHHIAGFDPGGSTRALLGKLGVLDKLELHRQDSVFNAEFPDFSISLPNRKAALIETLIERFPDEKQGLVALIDQVDEIRLAQIGPWLFDEGMDTKAFATKAEYEGRTLNDLLLEHISDPELLGVLGQVWMYLGLPPGSLAASFSSCVFSSTFLEGAYHVVGGGAALADAMVERLRELGGECVTRAPVKQVVVEDRVARGVELDSGEVVSARAVISNADPHQLFGNLVPKAAVSDAFRYRIDRLEASTSLFATYLGLDRPPSELGVRPGVTFISYDNDHQQNYQWSLAGDLERTSWCMTSYESADPDVAPESAGVISIAEIAPPGEWLELDQKGYRERKAETYRRLLDKYETRFPGLKAHTVVREFATPRTMARFTRNHLGAVYGLAQTCDQADSKRLPNRTPISGLFLTGAWTRSGGGYEGAMMAGLQTAVPVLAELGGSTGELPAAADAADGPESIAIDVRVAPEDLDAQGLAGPDAYLRYMDRGRVEYCEEICRRRGEDSWVDRFVVNVYSLRARFLEPTRRGDRLRVISSAGKTSSHRATYSQHIVNASTGADVVDAEVELLFLDNDRTLVPVPDGVAEAKRDPVGRKSPRAPLDDDQYGFKMPLRVYYEDTDAQGITYHVSYIRFCIRAIFEMFESEAARGVGLTQVGAGDDGALEPAFRITNLELRFLDSSALNDRLEVQTGGRSLSSHQAEIHQRIVKADSGETVVDLISELEFRDGEGRLVPVPESLSEILSDLAQA